MRKIYLTAIIFVFILLTFGSWRPTEIEEEKYKMKLSDYGFFIGNIADLEAAEGVLPYELNAPLFSDYAYKKRFIKLPEEANIVYNDQEVLDFPIGTAIIKTFYYPLDMRKLEKGRNLMETRVLLHQKEGWLALPYVWDEEQTEAYLDVAGGNKEVIWRDEKGKKQKLNYSIPNLNQCKSCHYRDGQDIVPIGPSVRQLNRDFEYEEGKANQLTKWKEKGWLNNLPMLNKVPQMADWQEASSHTLSARARAYLDSNCAHCHNEKGPANTSGLFLNIHEDDPSKWGVNKTPVAAGRASGDRSYSIVAGDPDASIMVYRMESKDPGVMMPEVSRKLVHQEGVALIREWIKSL